MMPDMSEFELPSNLARRLALHELPGSALRGWVAELPVTVEQLARRWSLRLGRPFQPGGATSWVAPARTVAGDRLVLKVGWRHPEALHEADGLRVWAGNGAVRLVDSAVLVSTTALLLEACDPGTTLAGEAGVEQDEVVAGQLRRLWIEPSPGHPFRPLADMCRWWADEF
jgi:streptomycin 6-kinase